MVKVLNEHCYCQFEDEHQHLETVWQEIKEIADIIYPRVYLQEKIIYLPLDSRRQWTN